MAETFSLANSLGRGTALRSNLQSAEQNRELNALKIDSINEQKQLANSQKLLVGIDEARRNPAALPQILDGLSKIQIVNPDSVPEILSLAQTDPQAFDQTLNDFATKLRFALSQAKPQQQFGKQFAAQDEQGNPIFAQTDPVSGESRQVQDVFPPAGGGVSGRQAFFESLIENLPPEEQEEARRINLGIDARAVGSAITTIADDPDLVEKVADTEATIAQRKKFAEKTGVSRANAIDKGFKTVESLDVNLRNLDKAIAALNEGAKTGVIESRFFPTIRASTVKLEQIPSELGLDVVGGVTFGALSKGEVDLALTVALPVGLKPPELLEWLQAKKAAQSKLRDYYADQIDFLDQGGSIAGFLRSKGRQTNDTSQGVTDKPASEMTDDEIRQALAQ